MIFSPDSISMIFDGRKRMTRRPVKEEEEVGWSTAPIRVDAVLSGYPGKTRLKWKVGRTYAIQPGRGCKAVGSFELGGIRCERCCDISEDDVAAEGLRWNGERWKYGDHAIETADSYPVGHQAAYITLISSMYRSFDPTDLVWVLEWDPEGVVRV